MKKVISLVLSIVMVLSMVSVFADADINVTIDGKAQNYDVMPVIENGRTLVPMRGIFEALGAEVAWDDATKTVTGTKGDIKITLQIGNTAAKVNDKDTTLDVAASIVEGRTMVPARFISESLGCKVDWDDATKTVIISTHIMSEAEKLCDRLGVIINGKKVAEGTLAEVLEQTGTKELEDAFFELYKENTEGGEQA